MNPDVPLPDHGDPYTRYRRALLDPARVRELSRLRPGRVVVDTVLCWAVIVATWAVVARWTTLWVIAAAIPIIGARYYALFIIGHDGMHRRLFPSRRLNDWWNDLFCLGPVGAITHRNNRNHLRHHQFLATEDDPDRHKHACFNKTEAGEVFGFLSGITGLVRSARNVFSPAARSGVRAPDETDGDYTFRDFLVLAAVQAGLIGGLTWVFGWWGYPVLWLVPVYLVMYLGDNFRSFAEHSHPESDRKSDAHRLITYLSNPVERFFLAPMNMNFHATHHLWPSIPYYHLPRADSEIRSHPDAAGIEWRRSYLGYLVRYWLALPLEECKVR
ncbi:MAG: fatty acid desaturase family protein [Gemmatimonadales bacterium]